MSAWHENCILRDDVREGTLTLADFAADLYGVRTGTAPNVYRLPTQFFDRTYPTYNLKRLVRDVLHRLAERGGKPIIRIQATYGGGKTHALIALLHLVESGNALETHPTVQEFTTFCGMNQLPRARVALLPFDKFDVHKGFSVTGPNGKNRQVQTPWGALAYQLAGEEGLESIETHEANYDPPAQPILENLLRTPQTDGLATLILIDEALLYLRSAVNADPSRLGTLQDFFQMLTQAVENVKRAALVASLLTSDTVTLDPTGAQVLKAVEDVFHRVEETAEPVPREDVAELLRRRLFEHVPGDDTRRPIVNRVTGAMQRLPLRAAQRDRDASESLLTSYPFHPELLDVFYEKWTQLGRFQRTRGVLRMFATALRAADGKDTSPFVGPGVMLGTDSEPSEAMRELVLACEEGDSWIPILKGELERARSIQEKLPQVRNREIEAAVITTFLHSHPPGKSAEMTTLYQLLAHPDVDAVSVDEGLTEWRQHSWHLKEDEKTWALGIAANLTNMHVRAMERVTEEQLTDDLIKRIGHANLGQNRDRVAVHAYPHSPADVSDTPELHFVIVGPEDAAVPGGDIPPSLKAFFERTYRNSVIVLAPEQSHLTGLRQRLRKILGWENIENGDEINHLSDTQKRFLRERKQEDGTGIVDSVKSTYSVIIAVDENGELAARQLPRGTASPFERVKDFLLEEERLLTTSLDPGLLTLDGYYDLWGDDETTKPVQGLYRMFATLPRLPRLLNQSVFDDSLRRGAAEGRIVLRAPRPDGTHRTYWHESPTDEDFQTKGLEIVPIEHAELHRLSPALLSPGKLPNLWQSDNVPITVRDVLEFFSSDNVPKLASDAVLLAAVKEAVRSGSLMARLGDKAYLKEVLPEAALTDALELLTPLPEIRGSELSPDKLPDAWEKGTSSVGKVMQALARRKGSPIPWPSVVTAINEALSNTLFEITGAEPAWPCSADDADKVGLQVSQVAVPSPPPDSPGLFDKSSSWGRQAASTLTEQEIQDLAATIGELAEIAPEIDFQFHLSITATTEGVQPSPEVVAQINEVLRKVADELKFG